MANLIVLAGCNRGAVLALLPDRNLVGRDGSADVALPDDEVSRQHAEVAFAPTSEEPARWVVRDQGSKNATWLNGVAIRGEAVLQSGDELRVGGTVLLFVDEDADDSDDGHAPSAPPTATAAATAPSVGEAPAKRRRRSRGATAAAPARYLIGDSEAIREIARLVERCAPIDSTVLVTGESGTGKELVAEALHRLSPRRRGPFVAVNCATIEPALADSELFGHERGAFTGAVARRLGRLELADGGTLFLDEVGELPAEVQAKLLRALERRSFQRVGGADELTTDTRIVAATHRDLAALVREGRFREDLLYRMKVVEIDVPPLRERAGDIGPLAEHFIEELRARIPTPARRFADEAAARLARYRFPGNVRELRNIVERCLIFAEGVAIGVADLPGEIRGAAGAASNDASGPAATDADGTPATLEEVERRHVAAVLEATGGNKTRTAKLLGIDRATLYAKLKRHGIGS